MHLISVKTQDCTYVGECKCIATRLLQHNSGHRSASITLTHKRPFAIVRHVCGFNGENKALRRQLEQRWKQKRDYLINNGVDDAKTWFSSEKSVIQELDNNVCQKETVKLRFVELLKD